MTVSPATEGKNNDGVSAAIPPSPAPAAPPGDAATPALLVDRLVDAGAAKASLPMGKIAFRGFLAGVFIGYGALLALSVAGNSPGLAAGNPGLHKWVFGMLGLPMGLLMVLVTGSELFTGNTALVPMALLRGRATWGQLAKSWVVSFLANFAGCLAMVALVVAAGTHATATAPAAVAMAKTSFTGFAEPFVRGFLCNAMVCMAIAQAISTTSFVGKFFAILFPIAGFVAMGFEHCVANMFFIPFAMALGADITWGTFLLGNLLPVTLGNIVSGSLLVGTGLIKAYD